MDCVTRGVNHFSFAVELPRAPAMSPRRVAATALLMVEVSDKMVSLGAVNVLDEALKKQGKRSVRFAMTAERTRKGGYHAQD